jgi:hypothetical protein
MKEVLDVKVIRTLIPEYGRTKRALTVTFGASGSPVKHTVTVPSGTRCREIEGEPANLFVDDISWMPKSDHMGRHDATYYGIRIPRADVSMS